MAAEDYFDMYDDRGMDDDPHDHNPYYDLVPYKKCPKCGRKLVLRKNGKTCSEFMGCSNFPKCRFTCAPSEVYVEDAPGTTHSDRFPGYEIITFPKFKMRACPFCGGELFVIPTAYRPSDGVEIYTMGCMDDECFSPEIKLYIPKKLDDYSDWRNNTLKDIEIWNRAKSELVPVKYLRLKCRPGEDNRRLVEKEDFEVFSGFVNKFTGKND